MNITCQSSVVLFVLCMAFSTNCSGIELGKYDIQIFSRFKSLGAVSNHSIYNKDEFKHFYHHRIVEINFDSYMAINKIYQCSSSDALTTTLYQRDNFIGKYLYP
eukprot:352008_1